jgi:hypothetical protein
MQDSLPTEAPVLGPYWVPTGVPLLDAVTTAMVWAREEGREAALFGRASMEAHGRTVAALAEVQRLWDQIAIELSVVRTAPEATANGGR